MSLIDFIQKIQKKPRYVRIQFLWLSVFICMFLIVSIWVISLKHSLSIDDKKDDGIKKDINSDMVSLKDAFKASISAFFEKETEEIEQTGFQNESDVQSGDINKINGAEKIKPAKLPLSQ